MKPTRKDVLTDDQKALIDSYLAEMQASAQTAVSRLRSVKRQLKTKEVDAHLSYYRDCVKAFTWARGQLTQRKYLKVQDAPQVIS